jgi:hypothetical protein
MFGFMTNSKDDKEASVAAKLTESNLATIRNVNTTIADATSDALKTLRDTVTNITKGITTNPASSVQDAYNKLQNTFSTTIGDAIKKIEPLKDSDKGSIKQNIREAITNITKSIEKSSTDLTSSVTASSVIKAINDTAAETTVKLKKMAEDVNTMSQSKTSSTDPSTLSIYSELLALYNSTNIVARLTFLLLILFVFILLLRIGTSIITWAFSHSTSPILLDGMINSKQMIQIPQNPAVSGAIPILRSVNDDFGIGFTWSVWINIDDFTYKEKEYKHVFHKGNDNINLSTTPVGMNFPNNSPGLYIAPDKNELVVVMNTFDSITEEVKIKDIPLNKWVCVIIRVNEQKQMDVYINGTLTRRHILPSIPKQNYGDVYVSMNGGFSGNTSSLRYYAYPIGTNEVQSIVNSGPNTKMISSGGQTNGDSMEYLATRWFFQPNA